MVSAFDHVKKVWRLHFLAHGLKKIQGTKRVARALHKQDRRSQSPQDFVSQLCVVAHGAQRIAKANETVHFFFERNMTANTPAHAFADEDCGCMPILFSRLSQCLSMRGDQLWQAVGTFPLFL